MKKARTKGPTGYGLLFFCGKYKGQSCVTNRGEIETYARLGDFATLVDVLVELVADKLGLPGSLHTNKLSTLQLHSLKQQIGLLSRCKLTIWV